MLTLWPSLAKAHTACCPPRALQDLISIFSDGELELLISGLPEIDVDDLRAHTDYTGYTPASPVIRHFWEARFPAISPPNEALSLSCSHPPLLGGAFPALSHLLLRGSDRCPGAGCAGLLQLRMQPGWKAGPTPMA